MTDYKTLPNDQINKAVAKKLGMCWHEAYWWCDTECPDGKKERYLVIRIDYILNPESLLDKFLKFMEERK